MNNDPLTLGSLFDGSGGFPLGGLLAGITPVWASEIEPFPIRVTTKRLPMMKHYGDISALDGAKLPPVDIITFGSPCQDMSIAGKRAGLDGSRSNLFYEAIRIIKEMRCATDGKKPRYIVWENVPGAFSSNGGEDFRAVLESICSVKDKNDIPRYEKWHTAGEIVGDDLSVAWRVLDAQYWGVPQRRKRVFLVADIDGGSAGKILFESEGVSGYSAESFKARKETAGGSGESTAQTGRFCLNDQGGRCIDVSEDKAGTLRSQIHGHPPAVLEAAGFCTEHSSKSRSVGYESERSPTLRAGVVPAAVYENHSQDTRYTGPLNIAPTVSSTYGTGGNNQPFVVETPKTLKIRSGCEGGGKGALIQDNKSATLSVNNDQTLFVPKAYGICSLMSNSMMSANPDSGFYEAETSRTLDTSNQSPAKNQGGIAVVEGNGSRPSHHGDGFKESEIMYTLNATEQHYGIDRAAFNQGKNALFNIAVEEEVEPPVVARGPGAVAHPTYCAGKSSYFTHALTEAAGALVATDYKDPPLVNDTNDDAEYIVRRLTPTECARLQGFPDEWCADLETEDPVERDLIFWREVFETHRKVIGTSSRPKSDAQIIKWLKAPHSDSAEYKMWGNGVCLPIVYFVLSGIKWADEQE